MTYQNKFLYYIFNLLLWLAISAIGIYLFLSLIFYIIGTDQFSNLQSFIFSHPLLYLVPLFLLAGFIGVRMYNNEDEDITETPVYRRRASSSFLAPIVMIVGIVGCLIFFLYRQNFKGEEFTSAKETEANSNAAVISKPVNKKVKTEAKNGSNEASAVEEAGVKAELQQKKLEAGTRNIPDNTATPATNSAVKKETEIVIPQYNSPNVAESQNSTYRNVSNNSSIENRYKVVSKAYLYTDPQEDRRSTTYINPSNSRNGMVNPVDEQNDFIYVVFTNTSGKTTMGWLRKQDLKQVRAVVYNNSK